MAIEFHSDNYITPTLKNEQIMGELKIKKMQGSILDTILVEKASHVNHHTSLSSSYKKKDASNG
jgi:hypothetical protein